MSDPFCGNGASALLHALADLGVNTIFGYPGGAIMPVYDAIETCQHDIKHVLVRHEQGAVHAAQGWARASGQLGVCLATSGPGATNLLTGLADAYMDSTPILCITGQVFKHLLGTDAFQEIDIMGMAAPVTKWAYQITDASEVFPVLAKAAHLAQSGRPGPVLIDITKNAQQEAASGQFVPKAVQSLDAVDTAAIQQAAAMINQAESPLAIVGQGAVISGCQQELLSWLLLQGIPMACTALGLSAIPSDHPNHIGMVGMHGRLAANQMTSECDVLIALGMRFDDRVTSDVSQYAQQAKVIHFDIDPSEINKNIQADVAVLGDLKHSLQALLPHLKAKQFPHWWQKHHEGAAQEQVQVMSKESKALSGISMAMVIHAINEVRTDLTWVTDVGQHQMVTCRYAQLEKQRSFITSGGLGTMGFCLPAAIGAQMAAPESTVVAVLGDGGIQMTVQELAVIKQHNLPIKILLLNNEFLGMVRQWQELYFDQRYAETAMDNPDFKTLAAAYDIDCLQVADPAELRSTIEAFLSHDSALLLEVKVLKEGNVFPIITPGQAVHQMQTQVEGEPS